MWQEASTQGGVWGRGNHSPGSSLAAFQRPPGDPPGPDLPFCSLSAPPVCYILALVLSCSLTFLLLIRSLVTHRLVAGSDSPGQMGEGLGS